MVFVCEANMSNQAQGGGKKWCAMAGSKDHLITTRHQDRPSASAFATPGTIHNTVKWKCPNDLQTATGTGWCTSAYKIACCPPLTTKQLQSFHLCGLRPCVWWETKWYLQKVIDLALKLISKKAPELRSNAYSAKWLHGVCRRKAKICGHAQENHNKKLWLSKNWLRWAHSYDRLNTASMDSLLDIINPLEQLGTINSLWKPLLPFCWQFIEIATSNPLSTCQKSQHPLV